MKKLLIILLALIALAVIGWLAAYKIQAPAIQADIKQRVDESLRANNLTWAEASVDGREVTIAGLAPSQQHRQHALRTANVNGANSIQDNTLLQDSATSVGKTEAEAVVEVAEPVLKAAPAYPYSMDITRDDSGRFVFTGIAPDTEFKSQIDQHLRSIGADPSNVAWNVKVSSATSPASWEQHVKDSTSALQLLRQGSASFGDGKALMQGVATSQNVSDDAEAFAQLLAGDYTTDVIFNVVEKTAVVAKGAPLVGSAKYAALSCQTEFNGLQKSEKIQFESGSTTLQQSSLSLLASVATISGRCPDQVININGYTDSNGGAKANKALSKKRAEAVKNHLVKLGINPARLNAQGYGEARPVASNKTEKGRAKNRRIELIVKGLK